MINEFKHEAHLGVRKILTKTCCVVLNPSMLHMSVNVFVLGNW